MKKRTLLLVIVVLVLLLLWWRARTSPTAGEAIPAQEVTTPSQGAADATKPAAPSVPPATPAPKPDKEAFFSDIAQKSNRRIRFYGKVIDQDRNPIPDVKVTLGIRTTKLIAGLTGDSFDYPVVTTDAQGRFAITDAKGALLTVKSLEKEGYEASSKKINQAYWYWRDPSQVFTPNPDAPEVFRMWKKAGAGMLVRKGISASLRCDGTPSTFDLANGRASSSGDLRVTLVRDPVDIKPGQRSYDWQLTIESVGGGLIESDDEQMYLAPLEGYKPKLTIHMPANAPDWTDEKSLRLYVKLKDGKQYARAEIKALVGAARETTPFYITSFINPSGSRNLEYDSAQNIIKDPPPRTRTATPTP